MAATQSRMIETASRDGPRLAVELVGIAFQFVPGVSTPKCAAALLIAEEVGEGFANDEDEDEDEDDVVAGSDGLEEIEDVGLALGAAADERTLGQKVLLHCCISVENFTQHRHPARLCVLTL